MESQEPVWTLGDRLLKARRAAELSQADLAKAIGVHRKSVTRWELGQSEPSASLLIPLARALGVSVAWLIGEDVHAA